MLAKRLRLFTRLGLALVFALILASSAAPTMISRPSSMAELAALHEGHSSVPAAHAGLSDPEVSTAPRSFRAPLGTNSIVVLLVEFTDMTHAFTKEQVEEVAIVELNAYYEEASYNKTHITGNATGWLSLGHNRQYYVQGTGYPSEPKFSLVEDAISAADPVVNFATYDYVTIVHAGRGQELSRDWRDYWSSEWYGFTIVVDGKTITRASVTAEIGEPGQLAYVGVAAHEFGHDFGLPDLYDTSGADAEFVSHWCLMGAGSWNGPQRLGESPAHMMGYCKLLLGYVSGAQLLQVTSANSTIVDPLETSTSGVHLLKIPVDSTHYYLVEVRQHIGYDQWLPGRGVVLSYVDETLATGEGIVNVVDSHPSTPSKDDGAFGVGPGAVSSYVSAPGQFSMFVEHAVGNSYNITILRAWAEFLSPLDGSAILASDFTIEWNASAAAPGINHYELFFDDALVYTGQDLNYSLTDVPAGLHNATLVTVLEDGGRRLTIQSRFVVDLLAPTIHAVFNEPTTPGFGDPVWVVVNVTDDTWIVNATLYYRRSGDPTWYHVSITQVSGDEWHVLLGTFLPGVTVTYYVTVRDAGGRLQTDDNAGNNYSFTMSGVGLIIWLIIIAAIVLAVLFVVCRAIQKRRRRGPGPEQVWAPLGTPQPSAASEGRTPADYVETFAKTSFCFSCGAPIPAGAQYCPHCGRLVAG